MKEILVFCAYYLLAINVIAFFVYGIDKLKAMKGWWRIPEATLLLLAVAGGSIGAWCGMMVWRHKTKHLKFKIGVPVIFLLQLALLAYISNSTAVRRKSPFS